jgi:hypothetical protein
VVRVVPEPGMVLLFEHRLLHDGETVTGGVKYTMRTDIMYVPSFAIDVLLFPVTYGHSRCAPISCTFARDIWLVCCTKSLGEMGKAV